MKIKRHHIFIIAILVSFLNPLTLVILGTSDTFTFVVTLTLIVWFWVKWDYFLNVKTVGRYYDILLGLIILILNFVRNFMNIGEISFGLVDMLVTYIALSIMFFGVRGLKFVYIPALYLLILVIGYRLEFVLEEVKSLEYFLAGLMSSFMNFIGINSVVHENIVDLNTPNSFIRLQIDGPCTGIKGMLAYGSLAILMIVDVKSSINRKGIVISAGLIGTFVVNLLRLIAIFLAMYFLGTELGTLVHAYLGYTLFIVWIFIFWSFAFRFLANVRPSPNVK